MIEPADMLSPVGPIDPSFFPGTTSDTLASMLAAFISDGVNKTAALPLAYRDNATLQWALYRAFDAIALRLATQPMSATLDGESYAYSSAQAKLMRDRAQVAYDAFNGAVQLATVDPTIIIVPTNIGSVAMDFYS